jgi:2-polyprenyl-6-methoxyphenol hydroxylase-like FAD-dependent oxidoreductase
MKEPPVSLHVVIVGAGIGGLCLAQGLHKAGVSVAVYERDASAQSRTQGYRFKIDPAGDAALEQCLPSNLYELYLATSDKLGRIPNPNSDRFSAIFDMDIPNAEPMLARKNKAVSRVTLRQVLLGNLEHIVHFAHTLVKVEQSPDAVQIGFSNGGSAVGNVLIAADGVNSLVRQQLLPHAEIVDTGLRCIYGKTLLNSEALERIREPLISRGITPLLGPDWRPLTDSVLPPARRAGLLLSIFRPHRPIEEAVDELAPGITMDRVQDYLTWIMVASLPAYRAADHELRRTDAPALHHLVLEMTEGWHADLRRLLELSEVSSISLVPIHASRPVRPWPASNVTFLGDAIHVMPPAGGAGANTALRDAALLTRHLTAVARRELELVNAIETYEVEMREYGFAAVENSLRKAERWFRLLQ